MKVLSLCLTLLTVQVFGQVEMFAPFSYVSSGGGGSPSPLSALYFDNNALDSSGNGYNGTWTGTATYQTGQNSVANDAATISSGNYVTSVSIADNLNTFTVTFWVRTSDNIDNLGGIVCKMTTAGISGGNGWAVGLNYGPSVGQEGEVFGTVQTATGWSAAQNTTKVNDNSWHFVAVTFNKTGGGTGFNANDIVVYIDASSANNGDVSGGTLPTGSFSNTSVIYYGNSQLTAGTEYYGGGLDDVRIYSSALTSGQISTLYSAGAQ
jgi:hypothetical protein